ncbi:Protein LYS-6, partial [Aphelenchoides avenae]
MLRFLLACSFAYTALATIGWDGIQRCDVGCFQCLKGNGYNFFIGRVWMSTGNHDDTGIQNVKDARAAGIPYVDAYIFPCLKSRCAPAKNQVEATINKLREQGANIGMLWLDIERQEWPADMTKNRQYVLDMAAQAEKIGVKVGVYANLNNWKEIVGLDFTGLAKYPLWYAHYDGNE